MELLKQNDDSAYNNDTDDDKESYSCKTKS